MNGKNELPGHLKTGTVHTMPRRGSHWYGGSTFPQSPWVGLQQGGELLFQFYVSIFTHTVGVKNTYCLCVLAVSVSKTNGFSVSKLRFLLKISSFMSFCFVFHGMCVKVPGRPCYILLSTPPPQPVLECQALLSNVAIKHCMLREGQAPGLLTLDSLFSVRAFIEIRSERGSFQRLTDRSLMEAIKQLSAIRICFLTSR